MQNRQQAVAVVAIQRIEVKDRELVARELGAEAWELPRADVVFFANVIRADVVRRAA